MSDGVPPHSPSPVLWRGERWLLERPYLPWSEPLHVRVRGLDQPTVPGAAECVPNAFCRGNVALFPAPQSPPAPPASAPSPAARVPAPA